MQVIFDSALHAAVFNVRCSHDVERVRRILRLFKLPHLPLEMSIHQITVLRPDVFFHTVKFRICSVQRDRLNLPMRRAAGDGVLIAGAGMNTALTGTKGGAKDFMFEFGNFIEPAGALKRPGIFQLRLCPPTKAGLYIIF